MKKSNLYLTMMFLITFGQITICSKTPERSTIYAQIVAMLQGSIPLDVTGTTTPSGQPSYPNTPPNYLIITGACLPGIESTHNEKLLLGKGKCQYSIPCFTQEEAQTLIAQVNIPDAEHQSAIQHFLTTGRVQAAIEEHSRCTLSSENGPLELSYTHGTKAQFEPVVLMRIDQRRTSANKR